VAWTAIDAAHAGFTVRVVADATRASEPNGSPDAAWKAMRDAGVERVDPHRVVGS
jgi:nicotinamidase/pyrazinamidase